MGLIGNRTILDRLPLSQVGGTLASDIRSVDNWHCRTQVNAKEAVPRGYYRGWILPQAPGGLSFYDLGATIQQSQLAGGLNGSSAILGTAILTSAAGLIMSAVAAIVGATNFNTNISGRLLASATLAGQGNISGSLGALANAIAAINATSTTAVDFTAKGGFGADIKSYSDLTPQGLANAVWNALASSFNESGTMGNKLNSASAAGDPWGAILPGAYADGEAGKILSQIQVLVDELHKVRGLNSATPSVITTSSITAGDIEVAITGDGINTSTFTRV